MGISDEVETIFILSKSSSYTGCFLMMVKNLRDNRLTLDKQLLPLPFV